MRLIVIFATTILGLSVLVPLTWRPASANEAHMPSRSSQSPSLGLILDRVMSERPGYLVINEHHYVDAHRHISACLIDELSRQIDDMVFAGEALLPGEVTDPSHYKRNGGYTSSSGYHDIWNVTFDRGMTTYGYDASGDSLLTAAELARLGLSTTLPNARDRVAAERLETIREARRPDLIFVHVGHGHVGERWSELEHGDHGWLAAHLAQLSGTDPITIYQMTPSRAARETERGHFDFSRQRCRADESLLLRLEEGVVGCADRSAMEPVTDTDFIILHPWEPGTPFRYNDRVCFFP